MVGSAKKHSNDYLFFFFLFCPLVGSTPTMGYDSMKEKILYIMSILLGGIVLIPHVYSKTYMSTQFNCEGECTFEHTINNQTLEIESDESMNISTEVNDSVVKYSIDSKGEGSLKTDFSGEDYSVDVTVDDKTETHTDVGIFSSVYNFFKEILFFGWFKLRI